VSPAALRTYRAERLLERDFHALRSRVLAIVASRLKLIGGSLDTADLEACYASAWQGLYGATVRGEEIANPGGWLALVTYRRAVEELRARRRRDTVLDDGAAVEPDVDAALDDRARLHKLFEGMRCRLDIREREAAALCYLHGYSRAEAARLMGISELRMRKLMDGRGPGRAGVAQKIGALAQSIDADRFCGEQDSLMRAFAFGVLEPDGERHQIALGHLRACPACRRRVASLRGLAAALPPILMLPGLGKAGLAALAAGSAHGSSAGLGAGGGAPLGASAAAGGGATGGGWALGGGLAAKLAAGCLVALGVGAGCVALVHAGAHQGRDGGAAGRSAGAARSPARAVATASLPAAQSSSAVTHGPARGSQAHTARAPVGQGREFTPEQPSPGSQAPVAPAKRAVAAGSGSAAGARSSSAPGAAEREFGPG